MHSPHDALFRYTFGQPEHAIGLLRSVLPRGVVASIDWTSLQALPGTRVDDQLRRHQSDLAFSVRSGGHQVLVYVLIEHKRRPERWAVLQLLEYVMGLWRDLRKAQHGMTHLPRVLPVLILQSHAGKQPRGLEDLLEDSWRSMADDLLIEDLRLDLAQPHFDPFVVDLEQCSWQHQQGLAMTLLAKLTVDALVSLPAADAVAARQVFERWNVSLRRLLGSQAGDYALRALWSYTADVVDVPVDVLVEIVEETMDPLVTRKFKPPIEQWRDQGREQGREQGLEQGREQGLEQGRQTGQRELLQRQLQARFGEISSQDLDRLQHASIEQLEVWALRLLDAGSLDEVFVG